MNTIITPPTAHVIVGANDREAALVAELIRERDDLKAQLRVVDSICDGYEGNDPHVHKLLDHIQRIAQESV
jgi:hypothetical protein